MKENEYIRLAKRDTGLRTVLYIQTKEKNKEPYIFFQDGRKEVFNLKSAKLVPVSVSECPKVLCEESEYRLRGTELENILKFIKENIDLILKYWEGNISEFDVLEKLISQM